MIAATYTTYGAPEVVQLTEMTKPVPKANEVLIKIHASTVSSADWRARSLEMPKGFGMIGRLVFGVFGPRKPILGSDLAGEIEAVGAGVSKFAVGDRVIGYPDIGLGCHAEYRVMAEDSTIVPMPDNLSFEEAVAICFGGQTALDFLQGFGHIKSGESVLIVGASGAVGSAAVQLAKHFGAKVTGVCSTANMELVRGLGADKVIDYTQEDFTKNGARYDIILDSVGTASWAVAKDSLTPTGRLLVVLGSLKDMMQASFVSRKDGKKLISGVSSGSVEGLTFLAELAEAGVFKPLVDRVYGLSQIVEAHRYVDTGRKRGNVVVRMGHEGGVAPAAA